MTIYNPGDLVEVHGKPAVIVSAYCNDRNNVHNYDLRITTEPPDSNLYCHIDESEITPMLTAVSKHPNNTHEITEKKSEPVNKAPDDFPQDHEQNEYRYLSPAWIDAIAYGLTAGAIKHPNETWRQIPAKEHVWRAIRHLTLYLMGNTEDQHLINASMRVMMAFENDKKGV